MTEEESKKRYDSLNFKEMNAKVVTSMMEIVQLSSPDEAYTLFHKIKERFNEDELAFLTATHIAEKFKDILEQLNKVVGKDPVTHAKFEEFFNNLKK